MQSRVTRVTRYPDREHRPLFPHSIKKQWDCAMSQRAVEYRKFAEECEQIADIVLSVEIKLKYREVAATYRRKADEVEDQERRGAEQDRS
jgi:hypothetical protein